MLSSLPRVETGNLRAVADVLVIEEADMIGSGMIMIKVPIDPDGSLGAGAPVRPYRKIGDDFQGGT